MVSDGNTSDPNHVQSVTRAVSILEFLASNEWSGVTEVGTELGVHKSTASRLLNTLESRGLVEQHVESGKYRLGLGLVHLANSVSHGPDITRQAAVGCQWLARRTEETVTLAILEGDEAVTIDQILSTSTVASRSWLGRRTPLHCTAPGKVFLANASQPWRDRILPGPHERYTDATIVDPAELRAELERVRAEGYATTNEEFEEGLSAAAAPVCAADGEVVAAIGISGPSYRLDAAGLRELAPIVREAGERASIGRGYTQRDDGTET
ncbi:transcriptional regulator, IclR family [Stackebrandtia nassauensis DSM 44728]|uniref:Glycerol operon regulatory protein n=1 Tax=Stackebrandtia nassauensis (strain DSM 44728 / CIP 108903 / NRRL B-16338 / NBRC 102104 / LLR-40K-21) TaxID=446470 RepID=D3PYF4_STANL|nr:transcriptional regulator, IclR family [Stackebrandtia nassauensis DSM 44728]